VAQRQWTSGTDSVAHSKHVATTTSLSILLDVTAPEAGLVRMSVPVESISARWKRAVLTRGLHPAIADQPAQQRNV
jgi:hypothetical protein